MIVLLATAAAGLQVRVGEVSHTVGECFEVPITLRNGGGGTIDVGLGTRAAELQRGGVRVPTTLGAHDCEEEGARVRIEPHGVVEWTYRQGPVFLPRGHHKLVIQHTDLGPVEVQVNVVLPEERTLAWFVDARQEVPDERFVQPYYRDGLADLARQGVPWAARALARMPDAPGVAGILEELRAHPLGEIRRLATPPEPYVDPRSVEQLVAALDDWMQVFPILEELERRGLLAGDLPALLAERVGASRLDAEQLLERLRTSPDPVVERLVPRARRLSDERLLEILETTGSPDVARTVMRLLGREVPQAFPILLARLERCEDPSVLVETRSWAFDRGERDVVGPALVRCMAVDGTTAPARMGLLHYVAWRGDRCGTFDVERAQALWTGLLAEHHETIAAGRQLATWAPGVQEAAEALGCDARPSVAP
ncbi:MAG: hypothetical protein R3F61_01565 [Myxococcota bacterium]